MVNILKDFCVVTVARENSRLIQINVISTERPTPPQNMGFY